MDGRPGRLYFSDRSITTPKLNEELNVDEIILKEELKRLKKITAKIKRKTNPLLNIASSTIQ